VGRLSSSAYLQNVEEAYAKGMERGLPIQLGVGCSITALALDSQTGGLLAGEFLSIS
jgi:hypothetical protein